MSRTFNNEKELLQQKIDDGELTTLHDLQTWIWRRGWRLRQTERVSKQNYSIFVVRPGVSRGFQIEVPFGTVPYEFHQPGIWIYALLAQSGTQAACYIGQTASVMQRLSDHASQSRPGRGSDMFFRWSEEHNTPVHAVLLELIRGTEIKGDTAKQATRLEGDWLQAAHRVDYLTPGVEKWGQLPRSSDQKRGFDKTAVWNAALPLQFVIRTSPPLKRFWLGPLTDNA